VTVSIRLAGPGDAAGVAALEREALGRDAWSENLVTEAVSVSWWLTKFCFVQGEIISSGSRWLKPQRLLNELSFGPTEEHSGWSVFGSDEPLTMFGATWSYQPSESS